MLRSTASKVMWVGRASVFLVGLAVILALVLGVLFAKPAHAESFTVNSTNHPGTGACDATECTLKEAINAANTNAQSDTIGFALGVSGEIELSNASIAASGFYIQNDSPDEDLTINGPGAGVLTIDGNGQTRAFGNYGANVTIEGLTIKNGRYFSSNGAGIFNDGTLTVADSTLSGNTSGYGGGIFNDGTLTVTNSTISGNTADSGKGGGILNAGTLTVTNSTISDNTASDNGGGIGNLSGTLAVNNSTISGNTAFQSGGIFHYSDTATLTNTIVAGNSATESWPDVKGVFTSQGYNLIGDTTGSSGWTASDLLGQDPLLGPLQNNGGSTLTHALLQGSTAVDAGDDTTCPATDQRGETRPKDGDGDGIETCDIGAFEKKAPPPAPSTPDLGAASDTGISSTDNLTKDTTPTFTGTTQAGTTVKILVDGVEKGADTDTSDGTYSITTTALTATRHSVSATATDAAGDTTPSSAALRVSIDTRKPRVSSVTSPTTATANLTATFSERMDVTTIKSTSTTPSKSFKLYRLVKRSDGTIKRVAVAASVGCTNFMTTSGTIVSKATLNPTNNLPNGNYEARVTPAARDRAGNALDQNPTTATTNDPKTWRFTIR